MKLVGTDAGNINMNMNRSEKCPSGRTLIKRSSNGEPSKGRNVRRDVP
jgi:hypothetical protein